MNSTPLDLKHQSRKRQFGSFLGKIITHIMLWSSSLLALFPIYFMISASFKSRANFLANPIGLPLHPQLISYGLAFARGPVLRWFLNSSIITVGTLLISVFFSCLAAYAIAKMQFFGKNSMLKLLIALMILPPVVLIVPLFILMTNIHLINTYWSAIIMYLGILLPFSIYLLSSFFRTISDELIEAAYIDGCTTFQILWKIMVPLSINAILTLVVVNMVWVWNELIIALVFLQSDEVRTIMGGLTLLKGRYFVNEPMVLAAGTIAALPMILVYLFGQRYLVRGLTAGSIK
jgi:ABC-type glycerol-3-phosphate transport system permease component